MWCSIVARSSSGTSNVGGLRHLGGVGLDPRALPDLGGEAVARAGDAAQVVELAHLSMPPRIGSSIARFVIRSAM